jgi:hypothetical protein
MKRSMVLLGLICVTTISFAQELIPFFNGKYKNWGYCNTKKEIVITNLFREANPFIDERAIIGFSSGKYCVINKYGNFLTECKYEKIFPFSGGYAAVLLKGKIGFINTDGKEVVPCSFDYSEFVKYRFSEERALVKSSNGYGYIDPAGKLVIDFQYSRATGFHDGFALVVDKNRVYSMIDTSGKVIVTLNGCTDNHDYAEGSMSIKKDGKWGFIDKTGNMVIPFMFTNCWEFSEGLAVAQKGKKMIYIDRTGKTVLEPKGATSLGEFHEGLARIEKDEKEGFINRDGKIVIPCIYGRVYDFKDGYAVVEESGWNGKEWYTVNGVIDKLGKPALTFKDGLIDASNRLPEGLFHANNKDGSSYYVSLKWGDFSDTYEKNRIAAAEAAYIWPTATDYPKYIIGDFREVELAIKQEYYFPEMKDFGNHFSITDLGGGKVHMSYNFSVDESNLVTGEKKEYSFYGQLDLQVSWGELPSDRTSFKIVEPTESKGFILNSLERIIPVPEDNSKNGEVKPAYSYEQEKKEWKSQVKYASGSYKVRADELYLYIQMQDGRDIEIKANKYKKRK